MPWLRSRFASTTSADGQLEQPSEVNSSTSTGTAFGSVFAGCAALVTVCGAAEALVSMRFTTTPAHASVATRRDERTARRLFIGLIGECTPGPRPGFV